MKYILTILIVSLMSCSKDVQSLVAPTTSEPKINSVTFSRVAAGSNESVRFNVSLTADSNYVSRVALLTINQEVWEVKKPTTGNYVMYDHIIDDYPTYNQFKMYHFVFFKKDGTKVVTEEFQVY